MTPSRVAFWLLEAALPAEDGQALVGDLHEELREHIVPARGVRFARWWFRWQLARSLAPLFFRSWQRASVMRAAAVAVGAAIVATVPGVGLLMLRTFVLQQVPLKTTTELSLLFAGLLAALVAVTAILGFVIAVRLLTPASRRSS